ncbi:hypothetical protein PC129_g4843 [Phytophthora cactorum]|uniref:Uncharacterized protein n=1 Tax=Phytophthora cactorum TaxID=29920 RepID=A0A329SHQ4_9STRA|nr:hypothetical protein Pcac1_g24249 [Phytophthora cactorum]KAG2795894.1 hypothetical protein PC111_g21954 [Phytophthora cactorum]KAG2823340.1 hypothetical protein PC113_g22198 [Phytophthora cactorum]KAG2831130.1 hypothetical protein PC112_g7396 [Phytophthora cactorum]KAG2875219.1 hypothetical protein PC114_g24847 [Phytophthora cactorum]
MVLVDLATSISYKVTTLVPALMSGSHPGGPDGEPSPPPSPGSTHVRTGRSRCPSPPTDHASQRRISLLEDELRRAARNYETFQHGRDRLHETTNHLIDEQRGTERSGLDQASEIAHLQAEIDVQQRGASNALATGADQQIGDLRAQVTQQNTELQDLDRRLDRDRNQVLERELDLAGSKIDILCTQISNQEREIDDLRDTLATSDHSLIRVRDVLRASANALTAARSDDTDLTALR